MTDQQPETVTVSKEEFETQKTELEKLKQIFDERQTKALKKEDVLKKDELLKALGIEKDPDKDPVALVSETVANLTKTVEQLREELNQSKTEKEKNAKIEKVKEIANQLRFHNSADAISGIDLDGDIEEQVRQKANDFPHYIKKDNVGGNFNSYKSNVKLDDAVSEALKAKGLL